MHLNNSVLKEVTVTVKIYIAQNFPRFMNGTRHKVVKLLTEI